MGRSLQFDVLSKMWQSKTQNTRRMGDSMKCDIGFWDEEGNYIPDIQEIDEKEFLEEFILDKNCFNKHQVQALFKEER